MTPGRRARRGSLPGGMVRAALAGMFDDGSTDLKARLVGICGVLGVLNLGAWVWSLAVFHDKPAL